MTDTRTLIGFGLIAYGLVSGRWVVVVGGIIVAMGGRRTVARLRVLGNQAASGLAQFRTDVLPNVPPAAPSDPGITY